MSAFAHGSEVRKDGLVPFCRVTDSETCGADSKYSLEIYKSRLYLYISRLETEPAPIERETVLLAALLEGG